MIAIDEQALQAGNAMRAMEDENKAMMERNEVKAAAMKQAVEYMHEHMPS